MNTDPKVLLEERLARLVNNNQQTLLTGGLKGIEKESLRIIADGSIAQSPHPRSFGSALTHPHITTDYSEALLEFITPPYPDIETTLNFLGNIQQYVYDNLEDELLLATSMPCGISGDQSIPIANYGTSNIGRMKHIYRIGLGHRYGRAMQAIAGIHFNYSVAENFWPVYQEQEGNTDSLQEFIADSYLGLIRNLKRYGWLLLYLFGSSPAICKSFLTDRRELYPEFEEFDAYTLYKPYATSLRMSDIGYRSRAQNKLNISYNSLSEYIASLTHAMNTPFEIYQMIGVKKGNQFRQLSANILQIENEYYSSVRPKQVAFSGEKPTTALKSRGVQYIEIRSLDIGAFNPIGIDAGKLRFIEALILFCLLSESPKFDTDEIEIIKANMLNITYNGRDPDLTLIDRKRSIKLRKWAMLICESMREICDILDNCSEEKAYSSSLNAQIELVKNAELTPSAKILREMASNKESFSSFALRISKQHENYFRSRRLDEETNQFFKQQAINSIEKQLAIESEDKIQFDDFLRLYFSR